MLGRKIILRERADQLAESITVALLTARRPG